MKLSIRYFKEYYLLKPKFQQIAQNTFGFGFVCGFFLYWMGWGSLLTLFIEQTAFGQPRVFTAWESFLVFIGLPISFWAGMICMAFLPVATKKITVKDAISISIKFTYPRYWLKESTTTEQASENARVDQTTN